MDLIEEAEELEKFSPTSDRRPFEIEEGSKAENSALLVGDIVLSVNGISCGGIQTAGQLIDSAFRTLTLKVLRGGWESSRAARALSFQHRSSDSSQSSSSQRDGSGSVQWRHVAHDDSALYAQSKASQQSAMKPSRPRRGDSFTVGKSNQSPSPTTSDPPWTRPLSGHARASAASHTSSRSSYPDIRDPQRPAVKSDRRNSDAPNRYQRGHRDRGADPHMVSSRSSPNLNKAEASLAVPSDSSSSHVKPVKSSSDIPEELGRERASYGKRPLGHDQQMVRGQAAAQSYGSRGYALGDAGRPGDYSRPKSKRVSEDMYTSDMNTVGECQPVPSHSLQKYQPDYENMSVLATAPLQSEKISEIVDIEDSLESDISLSTEPSSLAGSRNPCCPTPPERDLASLKYVKVNQSHEKYPSWPVSQSSAAASNQSMPINNRAQSWTDHTNTSKEFPAKQRPAYQPGLRPLQEKNSPAAEPKGDDSSKTSRNSSDPGLKGQPEFVYDRYGRVVQKRSDLKGRFEDFYQNSKPGYLPPRFDSDGHSYGDKEYSAPSPPERDVAGIDRHILSEALGAEPGHHPQPYSQQKLPKPQEPSHSPSQRNMTSTQRMGLARDAPQQPPTTANSPAARKPPGALPLSSPQAVGDPRRADMATSPLASPHSSASSPRTSSAQSVLSPSHRDYVHRDFAASVSRAPSRPSAYIVKQTPYYNTSTQTDVQSYAVKMSDPRARLCNVEIQVDNVSSQTSPRREFEEKSIQARMSHEFQPSDLDSSSPKKVSYKDKTNFFQYPFQGMQSIQAKYATDVGTSESSQSAEMFSPFSSGDQASIMRKLSEEFYGGNKMGFLGEKRHSSASSQEQSPKPVESSSVSVHSGTMSQAESYSSVIIHPSESAGPFGRDDFGSQSSITDSRNDLASLASGSQSNLKDSAPRGRNSFEYFPRSAPRPLQEARKFNSLSSISHQHERSAPVMIRSSESRLPGQDMYVDTRSHRSGSHRNSSSGSEPSPSQPKCSPDSQSISANTQALSKGQLPSQSGSRISSHHAKCESADSVFSEHSAFDQKEAGVGGSLPQTSNRDSSVGQSGKRTASADMLGRKSSMKKAYGIYDDADRHLQSPSKESRSASSSLDGGSRARGSYSDSKQLDQIKEEADSNHSQGNKDQRSDLVRHKTQGDISDTRQRLDSWKDDLNKRTGRGQHMSSEQGSSGRSFESSRPQRLFDGSIDSGVGSEILSRGDGQVTPSEPGHSTFLSMEKTTGAELKRFQQQVVLNFVQRKTGKQSFSSLSMEHSPESSLYESIGTPRSPHSPTSESVSDLISKTNEALAKRADSIRRTGSTSSRASSSDYVDMNRARRETEWSRLRNSGSLPYGSNRSSLCSENTYEDISVFAPSTPRSSTQEIPKDGEVHTKDAASKFEEGLYRGKMDSGMMASPTYQNFPGPASRRRAPPPPPRTPSPEPRTPPALPPRNYLPREDEGADPEGRSEEGTVEEAKIDFKTLVHQWETNSPREDAYAAQLRKQAMKFSGQRSGSSAAPSSMSVIHSRTQMGISTSYKRQPTVAQEATSPSSSAAADSPVSPASNTGGSSPQHPVSVDVSPSGPSGQPSLSPSSQTKELSSQPPVSAPTGREIKPVSAAAVSSATSRPPHLPERTVLPSRESPQMAARVDSSVPGRGETHPARDRSMSEVPHKLVMSPPGSSRERSSSETHAAGGVEKTPPAAGNSVHGGTGSVGDQPLTSPPQGDNPDGVVDPGELPPPPPELLNDSVGNFDKGEPPDDPFADDSYGAYKNRGHRQVGNYQRSSSAAAVVRPTSQPLRSPTEGLAMFGDQKLANQNWNSDSQLQSKKRSDPQPGGGAGGSAGGSPATTPDQAGSVQAFRADSGPVRSAVKMFRGPQPLAPKPQPQALSSPGAAGDGKTFMARPFQAGRIPSDCARNERGVSPEQSKSVKERISNLERKSSFSSASSSSTPSSVSSPQHTANTPTSASSQRWTSAASLQAAQRSAGDIKPQSVSNSSSSSRVPKPSVVLTDSHQPRERPHSGSFASPAQDPSTQSSANTRPRAYSEHTKQVSPPAAEPKYNQRYTEESPTLSDPRALPGHTRNTPQSPTERPRSSSSPYSRRESAPASQIPADAVTAVMSPRRKSEGNFLSSQEEAQKEAPSHLGSVISNHGRQPSQEELECDLQAKELAREVAESEKKLSDVLSADASKKRMQYMDGLFSGPSGFEVKTPVSVRRHQSQGSADASHRQKTESQRGPSPTVAAAATAVSLESTAHKRNSLPKEYFVSPPKAVLEMEWRKKEESSSDLTKNIHDSEALIKQKEDLIEKLMKKMDLLKEERKALQDEIQEIEELGKRLCDTVDSKCENRNEREKFNTYISDLEKIVRLLLNLSGQLARAENAVQGLPDDADSEVKKRTLAKRERLQTKHAEAKQLKEDIDKRSDTVSGFLRQSLSSEELNDYAYFVKMKSKLTIELQELEDKITLGQEQIQELKKSIPERSDPPLAGSSSPCPSPAPSPVPSS